MTELALELAERLLADLTVGEWKWSADRLVSSDGTTIAWTTTDVNGNNFIGLHADYEEFIAMSTVIVRQLLDALQARVS